MSALLFPGQGSQVVGMGSEFYTKFGLVKKIFKEADEKLNYPISKIILEGPENELQLTKNTQPAILTVSYSIFNTLPEEVLIRLLYFSLMSFKSLSAKSCFAKRVFS
jgi:[acyl-carrier-protein] S-malonyltransferase